LPELKTSTPIDSAAFAPLRQAALEQAQSFDLPVLHDDASGVSVQSVYGRMTLRVDRRGACAAEIIAERADFLQTLKDSLVGQLDAACPGAARALRWSDGAGEGALPANARLMTVHDVSDLGCGFLRVTLSGDVSRFSEDSIHFRLGLPPSGAHRPVWPQVGANGATVWPKGEQALHLPVYTARKVSKDTGLLEIDIFKHEGGRATEWASSAGPGEEVVAVGPGGGGSTVTGPIDGYADDTAFPAVARILEDNPDLSGKIRLYPSGPESRDYAFPAHPGVAMEMHAPSRREAMAEDACAGMEAGDDMFLWFAGERRQADSVRKAWKQRGGDTGRAYVAAYWQDNRPL
jgi:ferric-chelate reductase (NADPH)